MKILITQIFFTISILFLSNCQVIESRGQYIDDSLLPMLENKRLNKDEVEDLIGTATIIPNYTPNTWYYVQRSLSRRAWFEPKILEQHIIKITFNKDDIIEELLVLNNTHKHHITIINEYTKTHGTDLNSLQKFVKNIGRFTSSSDKKKIKKE